MKHWNIALDVDTGGSSGIYRTTIEANTEEEARELAEQEAYEDTWSTGMSWSSCKVYECEQVTADGEPLEEEV